MQIVIKQINAAKFSRTGIFLCVFFLAAAQAHAQFNGEVAQPVTAALNFSSGEVLPGGSVRAEVRFVIPAPWHIYWKNPGDAGLPTRIKFSLPEGYQQGDLEWPGYETIMQPGNIKAFGYEKEVTLASPLTAPVTAKAGESVDVKADVRWLACSTLCIPGQATLEKTITVAKAR